jgi:zinc/manganese transport system permease protein
MYDIFIAPFAEFEFMRRALVGMLALSLGSAPIGVFLMLRRMSLTGDAMAHAILPGAALGFLVAGFNLFAMTLGGIVAGFAVAIGAGVVARVTELKEDASLAAFYLVSLATGVLIVSMRGSNIDLLHVLFGSVLALDDATLILIAVFATITLSCWRSYGVRWCWNAWIRASCVLSAARARRSISRSWRSSFSISSVDFTRSGRSWRSAS